MSDPPKSSRWNSILETFGLTPPPEAPPAEPPPPRPTAPPPSREKPAPKAKGPAKPPRNWSAIAGDLGLEVPPEPAPPTPAAAPAPPAPPKPSAPPAAQRPAAASPPPARQRPAEPPAFGAPASGRSSLDDIFAEKEGDVDVFGLSTGREQRRPFTPPPAVPPLPPPPIVEDDEEDGPVLDYDLDSEADLLLDEEPAGLPPEIAEPGDAGREPRGEHGPRDEGRGRGRGDDREGGRRRRRRRGRGRSSRTGEPPAEAPRTSGGQSPPASRPFEDDEDELLPSPAELDDVFGDLDDLGDDLPPHSAGQPPEREAEGQRGEDRGARGRGRGRGRSRGRGERRGDDRPSGQRRSEGRRSEGRRSEGRSEGRPRPDSRTSERLPPRDVSPPDEDLLVVSDDDDLEFPVPPTTGRPSSGEYPASGARQTEAFDDSLGGDELSEGEGEMGHAGHKKIPTWQDAVAILIDANMAARASSPDRGHRGRRGGGHGGGRGR